VEQELVGDVEALLVGFDDELESLGVPLAELCDELWLLDE
jgi:hypothetical protein